jgi:hypothetical protein
LTKSLPPSLFQREELPLFGKEGLGEIFRTNVFSIMDSLVSPSLNKSRKDYLHPMSRATTVHPKRMTKKIINCLTNLGSIGPLVLLKITHEPIV